MMSCASTVRLTAVKLECVRVVQRHLLNPPIRAVFGFGLIPPGYALLETVGRRSGLRRQTPVGDGLVDDTFWIVAEHGRQAAYVRNIEAEPRVRLLVRVRGNVVWLRGVATILPEDDPYLRQRQLSQTSWSRRFNAFVVRMMSTELLTIRIDLNP
jgi:deazaflavin-dependent oxidoreductase (nitroreductase family)